MPAIPILFNVSARLGYGDDDLRRLEQMFARNGKQARVIPVRDGREILARTLEALEQGPEMIVAAGGDGTVSAVASRLSGTGAPLGILPVGTLNHFARDLGIPGDIEDAVRVIAQGKAIDVDMGEVNNQPFLNNASLGLYPDIVRDRTRQQRRLGRGKYWAMLWATLAVLRRSPFLRLSLELDGEVRHCRSPFVFIGNNDYTMEGFAIGRRASLTDGRLSIYTTQRRTRKGLLGLALRALFRRLRQADDFAIATACTLRIDSRRRRLWVATDGELRAIPTPLHFRVRPAALKVLAP